MASIIPHPTLLQSPSHIASFQHRHGLLIVLGTNHPIAIPALHLRQPSRQPLPSTGYTGPEAA